MQGVPDPKLQARGIIEEIPLLVRTLAHFAVGSVMAVGEATRVVHNGIELVLLSWQALAIRAPEQCRLRMRSKPLSISSCNRPAAMNKIWRVSGHIGSCRSAKSFFGWRSREPLRKVQLEGEANKASILPVRG